MPRRTIRTGGPDGPRTPRVRVDPQARFGPHQAAYTGPDLLRHVAPTTFQAKIDAEGWLHEERKLIEANEWSPPKHRAERARAVATTPDFETYAKQWIAKRRTDKGEPLRATTRANYEATLEHHLVPTFGRMRLRDITKARCAAGTRTRWRATATPRGRTPRPTDCCGRS